MPGQGGDEKPGHKAEQTLDTLAGQAATEDTGQTDLACSVWKASGLGLEGFTACTEEAAFAKVKSPEK
jgi:hypothetical protein